VRKVLAVAVALAVVITGVTVFALTSDSPAPGKQKEGDGKAEKERSGKAEKGAEKEEEEGLGPEDAYLFQRVAGALTSHETVSADAFERAGADARAVAADTAQHAPRLQAPPWRFEGPTNIGGRIVDVAVDPNHRDTEYIAAASGGVWKTSDAGTTFKPAWPVDHPQSMGAIAMAPDGTLYVGTGETNPGGGSITYGGSGVYRSTDGGRTWRRMGLTDSSTIGRIVIDPKDPNRVYAAVSGNLFIPGGQRGLYVSGDRGATWKRILAPPNDTTGTVDVAIDPKDPQRILASQWDHIRHPDQRQYTGPGSGIWRSTDRGASWTRLGPGNGLPPDGKANGRIGLAIDPSNPSNVFAIYANEPTGAFEAFFTSSDGGETWTAPPKAQADLADSQSVYGWWFARIWIDPSDGKHLFVAGLDLWSSSDGGQSFSVDDTIHPDQHGMAWDPFVKGRVYLGNDGGFYRSDKGGAVDSWVHAKYEPWSQFVDVELSEQDPTRMSGGLQDNGSLRSWGGSDWNQYYDGDGQRNLINPQDKNNVFACYQYGSCARSDDGGETMDEFDQLTVSDRHNYFNPMEFDPSHPDVVYYAGDVVNKSTDRGNTWTPISPDLGKQDPGGEINPLYAAHYGTVTTLAVAKTDPKTIWAGTDNGYLWKTTDGGSPVSWTEIESSTLPKQWVSHVAVDPTNEKVVYVTYTGFRSGDERSYAYRTTDGGKTWTNISANLPRAPVNYLQPVGDRLLAATDLGVFTSSASNVHWYTLGSGLPNVPVSWLRYVPGNQRLYASTFGRSVWSIPFGPGA
jgi:photosystem II stability/assembly factor-like uncharacterized protein